MSPPRFLPAKIDLDGQDRGAKAGATVGEMMNTTRTVFGAYDGGPEW